MEINGLFQTQGKQEWQYNFHDFRTKKKTVLSYINVKK